MNSYVNPSPTFHLELFGSPSLESDGPVPGRATQRHRLALLALLARAPGRRLSRDKLLAMLWPERDADRGRNLLKVATYVLREALGERALLSEGDDLRLNADIIRVDVAEFEAELERDEPARAVALYKGPFLDGFFLSEAPEFERWAERERARLADSYARALGSLAEAAEATPERTDFLADLAYAQALGGERAAALETLDRAKQQPLEPFSVARAYVALQEPDSAFAWLERSNWQWPHRAIPTDPALDPLRPDPRFEQLVMRVQREMGIR